MTTEISKFFDIGSAAAHSAALEALAESAGSQATERQIIAVMGGFISVFMLHVQEQIGDEAMRQLRSNLFATVTASTDQFIAYKKAQNGGMQ